MKKLASALTFVCIAVAPAAAASGPSLRVAPTVATGKTVLTLRGANFRVHRAITVYFGRVGGVKGRILTTRTDGSGAFRRSFKLGPTWMSGNYVFYACTSPCRAKAYARLKFR